MPHVYPAFGRFGYVAFSAKFKLVISEPCANVYLRHHGSKALSFSSARC